MKIEPKIVVVDIETLPILRKALEYWPQLSNYPGQTLKASLTSIICFGYHVYPDGEFKCICAWDFPEWKKNVNDDRKILEKILEVLDDADYVVSHNGKKFDMKFIQTRLVINDMQKLPDIQHGDTCAIIKKNLLLFNNRLGTLAKELLDDDKMENGGWPLWVDVHDRIKDAMKLMKEYCIHDVEITTKGFIKLKSFFKNIPNYNLFGAGIKKCCPYCGSTRIQSRGTRNNKTNIKKKYWCRDCDGWSSTNAADLLPRSV